MLCMLLSRCQINKLSWATRKGKVRRPFNADSSGVSQEELYNFNKAIAVLPKIPSLVSSPSGSFRIVSM
jgi:hypothetical protein